MPELPEVETVRLGLQRWVVGRTIKSVDSVHPRAARRHLAGADDLSLRLAGRTIQAARRRGKYLWLPLDGESECLIAHLGMSGQLLVLESAAPAGPHLRARFAFTDGGLELRFVDQRTFGGLQLDDLVPDDLVPDDLDRVPASIGHIARDPLDKQFDDAAWIASVRRRRSTLKRTLLDQTSISGVGNIYADEGLWRARLHGDRPTDSVSRAQLVRLLFELRAVFTDALQAGGTSFDALYVNVNGDSGYFDRSLNVYGREGEPCPRCGRPIARVKWMNRSSYFCRFCQRMPRATPAAQAARATRAGRPPQSPMP